MTTAERLRREGRIEGRREGELLAKREMLLLQLRQRFGRLPALALERIDEADVAELNVWFGRVLSASSLDEVLGVTVAARTSKATRATPAQRRTARQRTGD